MRAAMVLAVLIGVTASGGAAQAAEVKPFGTIACVPQEGVRFCPGAIATRVKTFDGVPIDVNVTLPADRDRRLPLIVQLHGYGGSKSGLQSSREWALKGYAVLNYSARGFGDSCGSQASRTADPQGCEKGWVHLADSRFEVRDTQYLAGLLADQGIAHPRRIGVMGGSYGGGQSLQLATLRDRVRRLDGTYARWRSPAKKLPMRIAAAVPSIPWSDLAYSLVPNGGTLDYRVTGRTDNLSPIGVMKRSYVGILYAGGLLTGFYSAAGQDPSADLRSWFFITLAGEPYGDNAAAAVRELARNHSAYYLDMSTRPAPTLISNGFTDDLFPVDEALRWANKVQARHPRAKVSQFHYDWGHPRGQNKAADNERLSVRTHEWFDRYVKGERGSALNGVEVLTQTCPATAPSGGPFSAPTWDDLSRGEVRYRAGGARTVLSTSGSDAIGRAVDPFGGGACTAVPAADETGTASFRLPPASGSGYTLIGSPTVTSRIEVSGREPALVARLWDVAPGGATQTLVARAALRPDGDGRVVFQLHPNAWRFEPGHVPKLELAGRDAPYARPSNFAWSIRVSRLRLRLPVHERPDGDAVRRPKRPPRP